MRSTVSITQHQETLLRRLWPTTMCKADIGDQIGRSKNWVEIAVRQLGLPRRGNTWRDSVAVKIDRSCLSCGKPFQAETRFIRRCNRCKGLD